MIRRPKLVARRSKDRGSHDVSRNVDSPVTEVEMELGSRSKPLDEHRIMRRVTRNSPAAGEPRLAGDRGGDGARNRGGEGLGGDEGDRNRGERVPQRETDGDREENNGARQCSGEGERDKDREEYGVPSRERDEDDEARNIQEDAVPQSERENDVDGAPDDYEVSDDDCNVVGDDDYDAVNEECCESVEDEFREPILNENESVSSDNDSGDDVWDDERLPDPAAYSDEDHSDDEAGNQVRCDENSQELLALAKTSNSAEDFKLAVLMYSLKSGYNIEWQRSQERKIGAKCADAKCEWRVYCSYEKRKQTMMIKVFVNKHSCTKTGSTKLLKISTIAQLFAERLRLNPKITKHDMVSEIKREYNMEISAEQCG